MQLRIKLFALLFFLALVNNAISQTTGNGWYTPLRNKLLHIIISKDSVVFRKCSFDINMKDYGYKDRAFKIEKEVKDYYIVSELKDSVQSYYLFKFSVKNSISNLNIVSLNSKFPTLTAAENHIKLLEQLPLNITLLNKSSIDEIRQRKDLMTMTVSDFKKYLLKIIEFDSINTNYKNKKYILSHVYAESTGRIILADLGYNSLVKGDVFDSMLEKFEGIPEIKDLFNKMLRGGK